MKQNKYTDKYYRSMYEIQLLLDDKFDENKWKKIIEYRKMYSFELPVIFNGERKLKLTQTPWILQKEIKMMVKISNCQQEMLSELSKKYSSSTLLKDISLKTNTSDIVRILSSINIIMNRSIVDELINYSKEPENKNEKIAFKISNDIEEISKKLASPREIAKKIFNIKDLNSTNEFNIEYLEKIHSSMMETIKFEKINSLVTKTSSLLFALINNNMFGEKTWEISVLSCMSFLRNTFLKDILKGIAFFKKFDFNKNEIYKGIEIGKIDGGDLTYLYFIIMNMIIEMSELSKEQIFNYIKNEKRYSSLSIREKTGTVKTIMRDNPELSKRQAEFFVRHNTKGSNYTLSDFQKYIGSSYETSRYSMDKLVKLGFYKKEKIGKKYVYKPNK